MANENNIDRSLNNRKEKAYDKIHLNAYRTRVGPLFGQVRRDLGWKGAAVADMLDISQQQVSGYERGPIKIETFFMLCALYELDPQLVFQVVLDTSISVTRPILHQLRKTKEDVSLSIPILTEVPKYVDMIRIKLLFKRLRMDFNYKQETIGIILGVTQQEVTLLESPDGVQIKADAISKVCDEYKIDELIFYSLAEYESIDFSEPVLPIIETLMKDVIPR